jgi:hypothetical protein
MRETYSNLMWKSQRCVCVLESETNWAFPEHASFIPESGGFKLLGGIMSTTACCLRCGRRMCIQVVEEAP